MAAAEEQQKKRTPFSAKVPQVSLDDALEPVRALAELGAPATPHVIAQHLGTSYATNARFRTRLGAAGYYGLIEKQGDKRALTKRGEAIVGGANGDAAKARQEAVMSTSFGPVIHSLRGRTVNEGAVSLRLQSDYGVPETSAPTVAQALVSAATQAGLVTNGSFDAAAIEGVASVMPTETPAPTTTGGNGSTTATPKATPKAKATTSKPKETPKPEVVVEKERPFVPGVQVVVKVDASNLTPQQIAELVRELQRTPS